MTSAPSAPPRREDENEDDAADPWGALVGAAITAFVSGFLLYFLRTGAWEEQIVGVHSGRRAWFRDLLQHVGKTGCSLILAVICAAALVVAVISVVKLRRR